MMDNVRHTRIGIAVVVIKDNRILLGKRESPFGKGTWASPGGHLEYGESPEQAAKRELFEETGLVAESIKRGCWTNDYIEEKHYVTLFMHVLKYSGVLKAREPDKCEKWEWFSLFDLPTPLFKTLESLFKLFTPEQEYAYLASPFAHPDEEVRKMRIEAATRAAYDLFSQGISVFSPLTHNGPLVEMGIGTGWEGKWEGFDLGMLFRAQKLYLLTLPGWKQSKGMQAEIAFAKKHSIPIEELSPSMLENSRQ